MLPIEKPRHQRTYVSKVYPIDAPNESTIIVQGHDTGVRILWRGGRPIQQSRSRQRIAHTVNGTSHNVNSMLVDDAHDEDTSYVKDVMFESEEEEWDVEEPYPPITQQVDLLLHTDVLDIAFPQTKTRSASQDIPPLLQDRIVVAAACADRTIRVVTLPLCPPSRSQQHSQQLREQVFVIGGQRAHREVPTKVSVSWTSRESSRNDTYSGTRSSESDSRSRSRRRASAADSDLLIASYSAEMTGLLLVHRVPMVAEGRTHSLAHESVTLVQRLYLPSHALTVSFHPGEAPSEQYTELLICDCKGTITILNPLGSTISSPQSPPRVSDKKLVLHERGTSIFAFSSSFEMPKDSTSSNPALAQRKKILGAQWVHQGRAILALMADGEWGVLKISGNANDASRSKNVGLTSKFAIRGYLGTTVSAPASTTLAKSGGILSKLAPMTPNTRRAKQNTLFSGPPPSHSVILRGGITVSQNSDVDESIALWYGNEVYTIPSFRDFWQRSTSSDPKTSRSVAPTRVENIEFGGEMINIVELLPPRNTTIGHGSMAQRDLLVTGEHRFVILTSARPSLQSQLSKEPDSDMVIQDQQALARGALDLGGMDRLLDALDSRPDAIGSGKGRIVGFTH
ncbi:hypothetical protein LTR66_003233 [Elasticomyces elasticus]|nr:hypothetical protein LTR66_003233 [Elasticomyces elasticus]